MRVAVVEDAVGPWSKGGRETRYAALLPRLAERGYAVEVFTMRWWSEEPDGKVRYTAICPRLSMYEGERRSIRQALRFALGSLRLLRHRFDVILADQIPTLHLFPLRLVAWLRGVKLIVQWHEVWDGEYWDAYLGRAGWLAARIERASAHLPDRIVAVSDEVRFGVLGLGVEPDRVSVVTNAIDRSRLEGVEPLTSNPAELVAVGRLIQHKRIDEAIRVVGLLKARGRTTRLAVVGEGPERRHLEQLIKELGLEDLVSLVGTLATDEEVWSHLRSARVLISASDREGFGLVVAESLALGTPVVCVAHPHNGAVVLVEEGRTGSVASPGDLDALTTSVARWLDGDEDRSAVAARFWELHPGLDWDVAADELAQRLSPPGTGPT